MNARTIRKVKRKIGRSGTLMPLQPGHAAADERLSLVSANGQAWPRDLIKPDLMVECLDSAHDGHYHLAHTFPLYLLSVYFQKAILFANRNKRPFVDVKR